MKALHNVVMDLVPERFGREVVVQEVIVLLDEKFLIVFFDVRIVDRR